MRPRNLFLKAPAGGTDVLPPAESLKVKTVSQEVRQIFHSQLCLPHVLRLVYL